MKRIIVVLTVSLLLAPIFSQYVTIPDANFLAALIEEGVDTNEDGQISYAEAEAIRKLYIGNNEIADLTGIEAFVYLDTLYCYDNQLTSLDISQNTALRWLICSHNQLTSLDVSKCTSLLRLDCGVNQISSLDLTSNTVLEDLECEYNQLGSLDISYNLALSSLWCGSNLLEDLDISLNTSLTGLRCHGNNLTSLDVSNNPELYLLSCSENQLSKLDVSNNMELFSVGIETSWPGPLSGIFITEMPTLEEVCIPECIQWEGEGCLSDTSEEWQDYVAATGSPNVCFQTDCNGDCTIVGIEEASLSNFSIYPNPSNSILTIETDQADYHSIEILSLSGQLIYRTEMGGSTKQIDLTSFSEGIYFVTLRSKVGVRMKKVVKY